MFSLTSVFVPQKRQNLASFISVDADAGQDDYGTIRILRLPSNTQIPGPSQIANLFGADSDIQDSLLAFTRTNSTALFGNLLTLPVGDGLLYVQPLYTQRKTGEGRYPVLRYVLVSFGEKVGIGNTLSEALNDVLGIAGDTPTGDGTTETPGGSGTPTGGRCRATYASCCRRPRPSSPRHRRPCSPAISRATPRPRTRRATWSSRRSWRPARPTPVRPRRQPRRRRRRAAVLADG